MMRNNLPGNRQLPRNNRVLHPVGNVPPNHVNDRLKLLKTLITILCVILMSIHAGFIISWFFDYATNTRTKVKFDKFVRPPALSICLPDSSHKNLANLTMIDFMDDADEFFGDRFFEPSSKYSWIQTLKTFYSMMRRKCMMIFTKAEFLDRSRLWYILVEIFQLSSNFDLLGNTNMVLSLHDRDRYPFEYDVISKLVTFNSSLRMTSVISYLDVTIKELAPPFTECFDYTKGAIETLGACVEKCMNDHYLGQCLYTVHSDKEFCNSTMARLFAISGRVHHSCLESCPLACDLHFYSPSISQVSGSGDDSIKLLIEHPNIRIVDSATFPLLELILFLANLFGLYLGASVLGSILFFLMIFK